LREPVAKQKSNALRQQIVEFFQRFYRIFRAPLASGFIEKGLDFFFREKCTE
jgi:hypothetical protein